jgi:hypothetical protein
MIARWAAHERNKMGLKKQIRRFQNAAVPEWLFISAESSLSHASPWNTNAVEPEMIMRLHGRQALQNNGMGPAPYGGFAHEAEPGSEHAADCKQYAPRK